MIVTCERCSTQFRLDDNRVPEQGVRVRCSRCKYAFRVERPASSEDERIQQAAARALEPDTPDVTQDLSDEEDDWEFNDHRPEAQESVAEDLAAESDAQELEESEPQAEEDAGEEEEPAPEEVEEKPASEEADFDPGDTRGPGTEAESQSVGPLDGYDDDAALTSSGLDLDDELASIDAVDSSSPLDLSGQDDDPQSGLDLDGLEGPPSGLDIEPAEGSEPALEEPPSPPEPPGAAEEIGSPEQWDFFAAEASAGKAKPTRVRMSALPPRARTRPAAPESQSLLDEDLEPRSPWLERVVEGAGWAVVAVAFAAGLYGAFASGVRDSAASESQQVAQLEVAEVGGRWVDNLVAGDLYVVSGAVRRQAAGGDAAAEGLFLSLLDADGQRLRLAPIPVGPPLPQALLRQADPADLHSAGGQALSPGPGATVRVEAVIPTPPAAARAFRFVTAGELAVPNADAAAPPVSDDGGAPRRGRTRARQRPRAGS